MTALTLARPGDLDRLLPMVAARAAEAGGAGDAAATRAALLPLLEGCPHGAVYLVGPARAPIGYVLLSFGWSLAAGGLTARIDEMHIRRAVRGRGIGSEVLGSLPRALGAAGLRAIEVETGRSDARARALFARRRFHPLEDRVTLRLSLSG
ncbi:GNAT family N-acetyltransferase [Roseovarius ramblicola]|uniref:GNAT family N-acetyltransferase n=1 Tax=Roseovarius ramblicola TaxID=2022336 RepID=A0ABV5I1A8_9RHOB